MWSEHRAPSQSKGLHTAQLRKSGCFRREQENSAVQPPSVNQYGLFYPLLKQLSVMHLHLSHVLEVLDISDVFLSTWIFLQLKRAIRSAQPRLAKGGEASNLPSLKYSVGASILGHLSGSVMAGEHRDPGTGCLSSSLGCKQVLEPFVVCFHTAKMDPSS